LINFKKNKDQNVFGRTISFGDSISINIDDVIFMENGPNFHTYTFRIERNNPTPNAPVENLLITPNPDGNYDGYWIVFNLNEEEKQKIFNDQIVDLRNKTKITKIENIGDSNLFSRACIPTYIDIPVRCAEELHNPGESCAYAGTNGAAYWTYIVLYDCFDTGNDPNQSVDFSPQIPPSGGGGGGNGSGEGTVTPIDCVQIPTDPTGPTTGIDDGGCVVGIPTLPNLPTRNNPCNQLNTLKGKGDYQNKMSTLKGNINTGTKEKGFMFHTDSSPSNEFSPVLEGGSPYNAEDINFEPYMQSIDMDLLYRTYGSAHNHLANNPKHIGVPTPEDLNQLLTYGLIETHVDNPYRTDTPTKAIVMVPTKIGIFALKINDIEKLKAFIKKYMKDWTVNQSKNFIEKVFQGEDKYNIRPTSTHDEQVTGFLRFMQDEDLGIDFYEGDKNTLGNWRKLELIDNGNESYSYNQISCNL